MASSVSDTVRDALGHAVREAIKNVGDAPAKAKKGGSFSGAKGLAAGAGLAAAAPLAKKGFDAVRSSGGLPTPSPARAATKVASKAGDKVGSNLKDAVSDKVDEAGGAGGLVKEAASGLLPGIGGDSDGGKGDGMPGVGKGRRMPVQQSVDVAVPLETAYNQWTQFEDWPEFMHRVTRVTQEDDCTVSFATKIWGKTKEFTAKIETQRPEERIKWRVSQGITHTGVVTFHELAPNLTRIELTMDIDPGSLLEKAARGMRHIKRAVRADLHRYKAFIEVQEIETGAWRGVIEDSELVEPHDDDYDEERDYSEVEDIYDEDDSEQDEDDEQDEEQNGSGRQRTQRFKRQAERSKSGSGSRSAAASRSSSSRSTSGSGSSRSKSGGSRSGGSKSGSSRSRSSSSKSGGSKSGSSRSTSGGSRSSGSKSGASSSRASSSKSSSSSNGKARTSSRSSSNGRKSSGSSSRRKTTSRS
jgi:uncharacterized membrane protein